MFVSFIKKNSIDPGPGCRRTDDRNWISPPQDGVAAQAGYPRNLPKIYTTKVHRHATARPKPRDARCISGGAIRCNQVPVPSDDNDDDGGGGGSGGVAAQAIQTREKTGEILGEEAVLHKSPKRESYRRHRGFSNRNKVEDSQAGRLGEYGYHFSSASAAESTRNGVGQFMSA